MLLYITVKEIIAFFKQKKGVFLWMIFCMTAISFVMNYAFSLTRYGANEFENDIELYSRVYSIICEDKTKCDVIDAIKSDLSNSGFPEISETNLVTVNFGHKIMGSDFIAEDAYGSSALWLEITDEIIKDSDKNICFVDENLLKYEGRLKMVGEKFVIDSDEFEINGVFSGSLVEAIIPLTKFREKYSDCNEITFVFKDALNDAQEEKFYGILREHIEHGSINRPPQPEEVSSERSAITLFQYSSIIFLAITCLASMLEFWHDCNKTTYAVYWLNGATKKKLMASSILGTIFISLVTYFIGLGISVGTQFIFPMLASLKLIDIILGFSLYIICFIIFGAVISIRKMQTIGIGDIRRDV